MVKQIVKQLEQFDGSRSKHVLFQDWCKLMAISISNQTWYSEKREKEYLQLVSQYKPEEQRAFITMTGLLWRAFEQELDDYLGKIYMEGGMGNKQTGQFFTPFHLACLTANLTNATDEIIRINEPASGGGGMILAMAKLLQDKGENYQNRLRVVAQDLDWNGVHMTYVQLSMAGVDAKVIQGDALNGETPSTDKILYTPMHVIKGGVW